MLEKEKVTQGIYLDLEDNNEYWVESRDHAEIFKKYGTVEDLSKNPRFKKIAKNIIAHSENLSENNLGVEDVIQDFDFFEIAFLKEKYDYLEYHNKNIYIHSKPVKKEPFFECDDTKRDNSFLKLLDSL